MDMISVKIGSRREARHAPQNKFSANLLGPLLMCTRSVPCSTTCSLALPCFLVTHLTNLPNSTSTLPFRHSARSAQTCHRVCIVSLPVLWPKNRRNVFANLAPWLMPITASQTRRIGHVCPLFSPHHHQCKHRRL